MALCAGGAEVAVAEREAVVGRAGAGAHSGTCLTLDKGAGTATAAAARFFSRPRHNAWPSACAYARTLLMPGRFTCLPRQDTLRVLMCECFTFRPLSRAPRRRWL